MNDADDQNTIRLRIIGNDVSRMLMPSCAGRKIFGFPAKPRIFRQQIKTAENTIPILLGLCRTERFERLNEDPE